MYNMPIERLRRKDSTKTQKIEFLENNSWVNEILGTYRIIRFDSLGFKNVMSSQSVRKFKSGEMLFLENAIEYQGQVYLQVNGLIIPSNKNTFALVRKNINDYYGNDLKSGDEIITKENLFSYSSVEFNERTKLITIPKGSILYVKSVDWTIGGTPRIQLDKGYISANKESIEKD